RWNDRVSLPITRILRFALAGLDMQMRATHSVTARPLINDASVRMAADECTACVTEVVSPVHSPMMSVRAMMIRQGRGDRWQILEEQQRLWSHCHDIQRAVLVRLRDFVRKLVALGAVLIALVVSSCGSFFSCYDAKLVGVAGHYLTVETKAGKRRSIHTTA